MRHEATEAEGLLWSRLRGRQLFDSKCRRQYVISDFIVDFCCVEKRLVIEVDGEQHATELRRYDRARTQALRQLGFTTIRFWNRKVVTNIEGVLEAIAVAMREQKTA